MKKVIAFILVFTFIMPVFSVLSFAESYKCTCDKDPLVYVIGRQEIYDDPTADEPVNAVHNDSDTLMNAVKEAMPYLVKAVATDKWDEYCDKLVEVMKPVYENYKLSDEGEVTNSSGGLYTWVPEDVWDNHESDSVYSYSYSYDPRLDPWDIADDLHNYIQEVKKVTGHDKVALFSRCIGSAIAMAYLVKYGQPSDYSDISCFILYDGTIGGVAVEDAFFTGNITFDSPSIERYADEQLGDDTLYQFLKLTVALFNKFHALDLGLIGVNKLYEKIRYGAFPCILLNSYATCPSYWSMLSPDKFNAAKEYVFGDKADDYSVLINKINRFHDKVQVNVENVLLDLKAKGINVAVVCKYGSQIMPITENNKSVSDNLIELPKQSYGATCSDIDKTLSAEYLAKADLKYISPDKQIDASTCLFPDFTWFIKDVTHYDFPDGISSLLVAFARSKEQMTIDSNELYPQYLLYDYDTDSVSPLTTKNCNTKDYNKSLISRFIDFMISLIKLIKLKITESRIQPIELK